MPYEGPIIGIAGYFTIRWWEATPYLIVILINIRENNTVMFVSSLNFMNLLQITVAVHNLEIVKQEATLMHIHNSINEKL